MTKPALKILLANPRGFCAGVDRAIEIVEKALLKYGPPVYVRHEIVHNRHVLDTLKAKGAIFVKELDEVPDTAPVIFSAHGVAKSVPEKAAAREMLYIDATCPLVSKVHRESERHHRNGSHIVLIGHRGHPEVAGTMGQIPDGAMSLVETAEDARTIDLSAHSRLAYVTQTTLSVDDTAEIVSILQTRFPHLEGPKKEDICYATTNRQSAVKDIAENADALFVVGAPNSSNSNRLVEVAQNYGCPRAQLVQQAGDIDWSEYQDIRNLGLTAGASAPETLVQEIIEAADAHFDVTVEHVTTAEENITFKLPRLLSA
ncbi:MAG: 4-hydroxy-3-methylbut-2-enyl diphosphate reductase [Pseudomonadota bacterium]